MRTLKSVVVLTLAASLFGTVLMGCSPKRRDVRHEVRDDRRDVRRDRVDDRRDNRQ